MGFEASGNQMPENFGQASSLDFCLREISTINQMASSFFNIQSKKNSSPTKRSLFDNVIPAFQLCNVRKFSTGFRYFTYENKYQRKYPPPKCSEEWKNWSERPWFLCNGQIYFYWIPWSHCNEIAIVEERCTPHTHPLQKGLISPNPWSLSPKKDRTAPILQGKPQIRSAKCLNLCLFRIILAEDR